MLKALNVALSQRFSFSQKMCQIIIMLAIHLKWIIIILLSTIYLECIYLVKLGNKERFDKEQIGIKEPFPMTNLPSTS